jgi:hypothetical protein
VVEVVLALVEHVSVSIYSSVHNRFFGRSWVEGLNSTNSVNTKSPTRTASH